ncbi:toxin HicA [Oscillatoria sp. FACHB-1406]|uniref:toxin HicA n=1 Tax=Oscillatoria sp. FACHB-1406 TaxID=2692846 RepID=UPI0016880D40|nr:toxin HicA [Oscillatoria sp. FACHB-1406]MBD2577129.1 toxin HicA [Oscillatoria sp. FACHB-1406]
MSQNRISDIVASMRRSPANIRFSALEKVCEHYFGRARQQGSHLIYKTPWPGDPRVNIQEGKGGKAKAYQIKQVLEAIEKIERQSNDD